MKHYRPNDQCIDELVDAMEGSSWVDESCGPKNHTVRCPNSGVEYRANACEAAILSRRGWDVRGGGRGGPGRDIRLPDVVPSNAREAAVAGGVGVGAAVLLGLI